MNVLPQNSDDQTLEWISEALARNGPLEPTCQNA